MLRHMFEISVLVLSCWFLFSLESFGKCLGTAGTKGYRGWERAWDGEREGKVPQARLDAWELSRAHTHIKVILEQFIFLIL